MHHMHGISTCETHSICHNFSDTSLKIPGKRTRCSYRYVEASRRRKMTSWDAKVKVEREALYGRLRAILCQLSWDHLALSTLALSNSPIFSLSGLLCTLLPSMKSCTKATRLHSSMKSCLTGWLDLQIIAICYICKLDHEVSMSNLSHPNIWAYVPIGPRDIVLGSSSLLARSFIRRGTSESRDLFFNSFSKMRKKICESSAGQCLPPFWWIHRFLILVRGFHLVMGLEAL